MVFFGYGRRHSVIIAYVLCVRVTLARVVDDVARLKDSESIRKIPLSLFVVRVRNQSGQLNHLKI